MDYTSRLGRSFRLKTTRTITGVRRIVAAWKRAGDSIGFVPTMGALHEGHRSLLRKNRRKSTRSVVSIFVNPTQFEPGEDFRSYPRTWRDDVALCRSEGVDLIFAPTTRTIYPDGSQTTVAVGPAGDQWEGAIRPGHFDGVATVVLKLFEIIGPDIAVFGQKDYQQNVIIRNMATDLHLPVQIVVAPTVRERGGLALSSRNIYLGKPVHADAHNIHRALRWAAMEIHGGAETGGPLKRRMRAMVEENGFFQIDYIGFCDPDTLKSQQRLCAPLVILIAATCRARGRAQGRRYIDNVLVR